MRLRAVSLLALFGAACSGAIGDSAPGDQGPSGPDAPARPGVTPRPPGSPGGSTAGATGGAGGGDPVFALGDPSAAGPMPLRRLSRREYDNTVRDLLGNTTHPADQFPSDKDDSFAFRRAGVVAVQDAAVLGAAAETLAAAAVRNLATLLPCSAGVTAATEPACARQFVDTFAPRAYRRPLDAAESDRLIAFYAAARSTLGLSFSDAIARTIEVILQSPQFLYLGGLPPAPATIEGKVARLGPYEIASRLSYFLWGSMPDAPLFAAADRNALATAADVEAQARRMLADPKARETLSAFFLDWLDLDQLSEKAKDPKVYPQYSPALQAAMTAETSLFVQNVVFEGDGRWSTLLGATYSFVSPALAAIYDPAARLTGTAPQRMELNPGQRRGFLTQPGFLALTGSADGSNPARRGKAIYGKLLCRDVPPPPPVVPAVKAPAPGVSTRQRFMDHETNPCATACHRLIDPLGFAFEHYDGIGRYRATDGPGPVDSSGTTTIDGASASFADAIQLGGLLSRSRDALRCHATQWLRFALARPDTDADVASIDQASRPSAGGEADVRDMLVAVATSRTFRYRMVEP